MTSYAHDVFYQKWFLIYSVKNYFQNIKAELCVYRPTGIHIYFRTGFILILDPENTGLDNFKSKLS